MPIKTITSSTYTASSSDTLIKCNCTSNTIDITLFDTYSFKDKVLTFKKVDSSANAVTITPATGETIDGLASIEITSQNEYITIIAYADGWGVVDRNTDSISVSDRIGQSTDFASHETVLGYNNTLYQHVHMPAKCYPTLANGVTVTGGADAWTLGDFVEIVPASTITNAFDVHWVNFEAVSANDTFEFVLYKGAEGSEEEIGRCRTYKTSTASGSNSVRIQIPAQNPNTRISAKLASSGGGSDTATVSLFYHEYE